MGWLVYLATLDHYSDALQGISAAIRTSTQYLALTLLAVAPQPRSNMTDAISTTACRYKGVSILRPPGTIFSRI